LSKFEKVRTLQTCQQSNDVLISGSPGNHCNICYFK
jgi:hypothetical protein